MAPASAALRLAAAGLLIGLCAGQGAGPLAESPAGVPIAVEIIDGPPAPVKTALASELATAASSRQVDLVGSDAAARFRVRGYLSTETDAEGTTTLAYVWDVFDAEKRRAKRLTGSSPIRNASPDPWTGLDREALARLAALSMDEIAAFLSEAKSAGTAALAAAPGPALAYSTE